MYPLVQPEAFASITDTCHPHIQGIPCLKPEVSIHKSRNPSYIQPERFNVTPGTLHPHRRGPSHSRNASCLHSGPFTPSSGLLAHSERFMFTFGTLHPHRRGSSHSRTLRTNTPGTLHVYGGNARNTPNRGNLSYLMPEHITIPAGTLTKNMRTLSLF